MGSRVQGQQEPDEGAPPWRLSHRHTAESDLLSIAQAQMQQAAQLPSLQRLGSAGSATAAPHALPSLQRPGSTGLDTAAPHSLPSLQRLGTAGSETAAPHSLPSLQRLGSAGPETAAPHSLPSLQRPGSVGHETAAPHSLSSRHIDSVSLDRFALEANRQRAQQSGRARPDISNQLWQADALCPAPQPRATAGSKEPSRTAPMAHFHARVSTVDDSAAYEAEGTKNRSKSSVPQEPDASGGTPGFAGIPRVSVSEYAHRLVSADTAAAAEQRARNDAEAPLTP